MAKKSCPYNQVIHILQELKKQYPLYTMGQHISTALSDYGDVWGLPDKEMLFALEKYKTELEFNIVPEKEIDKIIEEGKDLYTLFKDDENQEEDYE